MEKACDSIIWLTCMSEVVRCSVPAILRSHRETTLDPGCRHHLSRKPRRKCSRHTLPTCRSTDPRTRLPERGGERSLVPRFQALWTERARSVAGRHQPLARRAPHPHRLRRLALRPPRVQVDAIQFHPAADDGRTTATSTIRSRASTPSTATSTIWTNASAELIRS